MPIYEYQCQACGGVRELMQKISDPAPEACTSCSAGPMVKLMSRTAFVLKGEGWYVTDFRDGGKKPSNNEGGTMSSPSVSPSPAAGTPSGATDASKANESSQQPAAASPATAAAEPAKSTPTGGSAS